MKAATLSFLLGLSIVANASDVTAESGTAVLDAVKSRYAALGTYRDHGTIVTEIAFPGAHAIVERHQFSTAYRAPREFIFEYQEDVAAGGDRFVIWCAGGDFMSWWSATSVRDTWDRGRGTMAFTLATIPTHYSSMQIAPLLFTAAAMQGPVAGMIDPELQAVEDWDGRAVIRIHAEMRAVGSALEQRPTTLWVDAENFIILKVLEDTQPGSAAGVVNRRTTTFVADEKPTFKEQHFDFQPPMGAIR